MNHYFLPCIEVEEQFGLAVWVELHLRDVVSDVSPADVDRKGLGVIYWATIDGNDFAVSYVERRRERDGGYHHFIPPAHATVWLTLIVPQLHFIAPQEQWVVTEQVTQKPIVLSVNAWQQRQRPFTCTLSIPRKRA